VSVLAKQCLRKKSLFLIGVPMGPEIQIIMIRLMKRMHWKDHPLVQGLRIRVIRKRKSRKNHVRIWMHKW
jgi:hypothetical protein